jgi:hypothetical protein
VFVTPFEHLAVVVYEATALTFREPILSNRAGVSKCTPPTNMIRGSAEPADLIEAGSIGDASEM